MVRNAPGVTPKLTRKWRERKIDELQDLVEEAHRKTTQEMGSKALLQPASNLS